VNSAQTDALYDGLNPVQEGALPTTPAANLLTGLGVDELFTRTDAAGLRAFLPDALGSAVALADASGTVQTAYTYAPFGDTTVTGTASDNPYQFTGREDDGTGLYYYRARYYHAGLGRFVSEDPLEFGGGDANLYAYVFNAPTTYADPLGLYTASFCIKGSAGGFGFGGGGGGCVNFGYGKKEGFSTSLSGTFGGGGFAGVGAAVGGTLGVSNAPTVFGLTGGSISLGAGGTVLPGTVGGVGG